MENYILLGPQLEASQDRRLCLGEWMVPFMSSLQVCPCIISDFYKTINSISGEVTGEKTKTEDKYTGIGLIAHLDMLESQSAQHSEVQISPNTNRESVQGVPASPTQRLCWKLDITYRRYGAAEHSHLCGSIDFII